MRTPAVRDPKTRRRSVVCSRKLKADETSLEKNRTYLNVKLVGAALNRTTGNSLVQPNIDQLCQLTADLGTIQARVRIDKELNAVAYHENKTSSEALKTLTTYLSKRQTSLSAILHLLQDAVAECENDDRPNAEYNTAFVRAAKDKAARPLELSERALAILAELSNSSDFFFPVTEKPAFLEKWTQLLPELVAAFQAAMRAANPTQPLAVHANGPCARFLNEMIPYLTGETTTPAVLLTTGGGGQRRGKKPFFISHPRVRNGFSFLTAFSESRKA